MKAKHEALTQRQVGQPRLTLAIKCKRTTSIAGVDNILAIKQTFTRGKNDKIAFLLFIALFGASKSMINVLAIVTFLTIFLEPRAT
jgi:hypothetical protein